ncbi:MAG: membrane integrity-associated transporter subunit PqiC [Congregibacter sp.]
MPARLKATTYLLLPVFIYGCILGCTVSSPPIRHLQLATGTGLAPAARDYPVIALDAVAVPDYLLRDELVLRDGPYSLRYDSNRRWAEPVDLGIQRVMAARLGALLGTRQVVSFPRAPRLPVDWELTLDVHEFETYNDKAILRAEGRWEQVGDKESLSIVVSFDESLPLPLQEEQAAASALSSLLWRFAEELAQPLLVHTDAAQKRQ